MENWQGNKVGSGPAQGVKFVCFENYNKFTGDSGGIGVVLLAGCVAMTPHTASPIA